MAVEDFFTVTSITSLGGAALVVNVVANTLFKIARLDQQKTAFFTGLIIAVLSVAIKPDPLWWEWFIAFPNGCLIFCTAMGMNDIAEKGSRSRRLAPSPEARKPPFFSSWHH